MSGFLKDLFSVGFSKIRIIIFGVAKSVILARWLGPELNGTIAALAVYPALFMTIGSLGLRQSTAYYVGKQLYAEEAIKRAVVQVWFLSCVISLVICFYLIRYFSSSGEELLLVALAIMPIPFTLFNTYNSGFFLGKNLIRKFNQINWLPPLISLIGITFLVVILDLSIEGAMAAAVTGPLLMSIIMLRKNGFFLAFSLKLELRVIQSLLSLGMVYAIALLVINLNYKLDIILLDKLSTDYETGVYSKGASLIQYLWQIPMLLSTIIFARSASAKNSLAFSKTVTKLLRVSFIVIGSASLVLALIAPWMIELLFGKAFLPSATVLLYLLPGVLLLTIFKVLNMDLAGRGKPWISMKAMVPALVVNVVLNIFLIPIMGANGAAVASTVSYSLAAILFLLIYSKEVQIPVKEIMHYRKSDFNFINIIQSKLGINLVKL